MNTPEQRDGWICVPDTARVRLGARTTWEEPRVAGKKRPKSVAQTEKKPPAKPKRPKKTSRGK
jgi:hypothetical protein